MWLIPRAALEAARRWLDEQLGFRRDPPSPRDPYAWKPVAPKPRPKGRSGAVAVAEPDDE